MNLGAGLMDLTKRYVMAKNFSDIHIRSAVIEFNNPEKLKERPSTNLPIRLTRKIIIPKTAVNPSQDNTMTKNTDDGNVWLNCFVVVHKKVREMDM